MPPHHPMLAEALRLHRSGDHARALELYHALLQAEPHNYDAIYGLGFLHGQNRDFDCAEFYFGEALKVNPASADALFMRGYALQQLGRHDEAIACLGRVLALRPAFPEALLNRASSSFRLRRYSDAAADYQALLALDPDFPFARGNLSFSRLHDCDWREFDQMNADIEGRLLAGKRVIAPFDAKALYLSPAEELRCAKIWVADQCPPAPALWNGERYRHDRIRLAYVSADFHAHAVATLTAALFEHHDRNRFKTIGLSLGPDDGSEMRSRLVHGFDRFVDARGKSDNEIAGLLREMEVDVAIDLMGFTEGCRPGIFAARPAPVQVNYLGFAGTMGADYMDYLIGDEIVVPRNRHAYYREKIVTLPDSFMPSDSARAISARNFTRADEGLPESGFVFCCFNAGYKINPPLFDIWMRLLSRIDESVLWLGQANGNAQRNLKREAEARGVGADRLIFARFVESPEDHLARLKLADLFLDSMPYNAHATANDALWAGVPVLTCIGEGFAGRVAASLLHAVGLPDLIAVSPESYERRALELATDAGAMRDLRAKLSQNKTTYPLFDAARYTRHLETAYVTIWERQQRGLSPESFTVPAP